MQKTTSRRTFFRSLARIGAVALGAPVVSGLSRTTREVRLKADTTLLRADTTLLQSATGATDWPEWRGRGRLGVWTETGILDRFPEKGLQVLWRTPIRSGYAGSGRLAAVACSSPTS